MIFNIFLFDFGLTNTMPQSPSDQIFTHKPIKVVARTPARCGGTIGSPTVAANGDGGRDS